MGKIKLITDSTCDIPHSYRQMYDITVVPPYIIFGTEMFKDGVTIDYPTFMKRLVTSRELPKTAQPSPADFLAAYQQAGANGDQVLVLTVTSKLSGTYQSAVLASQQAEALGLHVQVFDSLSGTSGLGWQVIDAARMASAGASLAQIMARLEHARATHNLWVALNSLEYAVRGGRVPKLQGLLASALNVKPIVILRNGLLEPSERIRSRKKQLERVVELAAQTYGRRPCAVAVTHAEAEGEATQLMADLRARLNVMESYTAYLTVALTVHFGPGALAVVVYPLAEPAA